MRRVPQVQVSTPLFAGGLWLLSISLFGAAFAVLPVALLVPIVKASVMVQTSHQMAPVALAWANGEFRRTMRVRWRKFLLLPAAVFTAAVVLPFHWVSLVYLAWNAYHYGMQNYGVLALCRKLQWRKSAMGICLAVTSVPLLLIAFYHPSWAWVFAFQAAMSFNHWIVDVGLSGRASRWGWLFIGGILVVGLVGFVFYDLTPRGFHPRSDQLLQIAMALGFVHFLYSRFVWRLSDPMVRSTIGHKLFRESAKTR